MTQSSIMLSSIRVAHHLRNRSPFQSKTLLRRLATDSPTTIDQNDMDGNLNGNLLASSRTNTLSLRLGSSSDLSTETCARYIVLFACELFAQLCAFNGNNATESARRKRTFAVGAQRANSLAQSDLISSTSLSLVRFRFSSFVSDR